MPAFQRGRSPPRPARGSDRSLPTERDCRKYAREFLRADQDQDGLITAQEAKILFERSGLGNDVLMMIWELADVNRTYKLSFVEFIAAMHLIRRVRSGVPPPQPPGGLPPELMEFLRSFQGSAAALATEGNSRSASVSRSRSATPSRLGSQRAVPTQRDCRKYAREFQRIDRYNEGRVTIEDAKSVFFRSGLPGEVVTQLMDVVDSSRRGFLGFVDFVVAMHLIRNARAGVPLPQRHMGLPLEIQSFMLQFRESASQLAEQGSSRSASRSRSQTPAPPAFPAESSNAPCPFGAPQPFDAQTSYSFDGASPPRDSQRFGDFGSFGFGDGGGTKHKKEKKEHRRDRHQGDSDWHNGFHDDFKSGGNFQNDGRRDGDGALSGDAQNARSGPQNSAPWGDAQNARSSPQNSAQWGDAQNSLGHFDTIGLPEAAHASARVADYARQQTRTPQTRMGLPVQDPPDTADADLALVDDGKDAAYRARMREIMGKGGDDAQHKQVARGGGPPCRWYAAGRGGSFDPRGSPIGDYSSPVMKTVLMGAKPGPSTSQDLAGYQSAVSSTLLPPDAAPFLRTIMPNYQSASLPLPGHVSVPKGGGMVRSPPPPLTATDLQHRFLSTYTSTSSARSMREQIEALPSAYRSNLIRTP